MSCGIVWMIKKDNEEGRAPLEYLPRGPRVSSYATVRRHTSDCFLRKPFEGISWRSVGCVPNGFTGRAPWSVWEAKTPRSWKLFTAQVANFRISVAVTSQNVAVRLLTLRPLPPAPGGNWPPYPPSRRHCLTLCDSGLARNVRQQVRLQLCLISHTECVIAGNNSNIRTKVQYASRSTFRPVAMQRSCK